MRYEEYDDLKSRLMSVGLMLRHMLAHSESDMVVRAEIMVALEMVRPELDALDAVWDAQIAETRAGLYGATLDTEASQVFQEMSHGTGELTL